MTEPIGTPSFWIGFNACVVLLLALDLGVLRRRAHAVSLREAALWSAVWVLISLLFNLWIWHRYGASAGLDFFTSYLTEKALSVDNLFVFVLIFRYFAVEERNQHSVLYWGVLGALVMRGMLIGVGVLLIARFAWVLYVFGGILVYAGLRMMIHKIDDFRPDGNLVIRWARRVIPLTNAETDDRFFAREGGEWRATPLLFALLMLESEDLVCAIDSIPAVFAITRDPFIVYSSNVCAILGLRALYFLLASAARHSRGLSNWLAIVLIFIGAKMLGEPWVKIPTEISLFVIGGVLTTAVLIMLVASKVTLHPSQKGSRPQLRTTPEDQRFPSESGGQQSGKIWQK